MQTSPSISNTTTQVQPLFCGPLTAVPPTWRATRACPAHLFVPDQRQRGQHPHLQLLSQVWALLSVNLQDSFWAPRPVEPCTFAHAAFFALATHAVPSTTKSSGGQARATHSPAHLDEFGLQVLAAEELQVLVDHLGRGGQRPRSCSRSVPLSAIGPSHCPSGTQGIRARPANFVLPHMCARAPVAPAARALAPWQRCMPASVPLAPAPPPYVSQPPTLQGQLSR
jgi:hypothetical protein